MSRVPLLILLSSLRLGGLAAKSKESKELPPCYESCSSYNKCTTDRTCPEKYLQQRWTGSQVYNKNRYNCFPESACPIPKNYQKPSFWLSTDERYFVTDSLTVMRIDESEIEMSEYVDKKEKMMKERAGRKINDGVIPADRDLTASDYQYQTSSSRSRAKPGKRTARDTRIARREDSPASLLSPSPSSGKKSDEASSSSQPSSLAEYGFNTITKYLYLKYSHLAYFSTFFHIMSTEHDHTFSIYNNKFDTKNACLLPNPESSYDVSLGHCDGSDNQNWIIYQQKLNHRNSTVYLLQNIETKGCLSINKYGRKLELSSCDGNAGGLVMVPVTIRQYHENRVMSSNITREPKQLTELPEHELSLLSDNFVYLIIHGSAVFAIFIIFCSFYYVHTHRKLFQDIIHL